MAGQAKIPLRLRLVKATRLFAPARLSAGVAADAIVDFRRIRPKQGVRLAVGERSLVHAHIMFDREGASLEIGARTFVGAGRIVVATSVSIGSDVLISWGFTIVDHDSHSMNAEIRKNDVAEWYFGRKSWEDVAAQPVRVEDRAWIGFDAVILKGVTVGEGAIVAARAVVTKDVEPWTVVAGNPARLIRTLSQGEKSVLDAGQETSVEARDFPEPK